MSDAVGQLNALLGAGRRVRACRRVGVSACRRVGVSARRRVGEWANGRMGVLRREALKRI